MNEMTFKQMQDRAAMAGKEMKGNPEAMAAMKKMMGSVIDSFKVIKEGPGEQIAGYATEKYLIQGPADMEVWAAPNLKVPAAYYDVLKFQMPPNPMFDMNKLYDEMKKVDGIPMKTVTSIKMMGMEMKTTQVVTSVDKGVIAPSLFEVPAGYKLVQQK